MNRHRWKLLLSLLLSLVFLVIVAVLIKDWVVETPADQLDQAKAQLDQELQLKTPPAYETVEDTYDSSAVSCEPEVLGYYSSRCLIVPTETTSATKLASIVEDTASDTSGPVLRVDFNEESEIDPRAGATIATSYCFVDKSVAVSALGSALKDAELLGKTDNCYLALYKPPFSGFELLKPSN